MYDKFISSIPSPTTNTSILMAFKIDPQPLGGRKGFVTFGRIGREGKKVLGDLGPDVSTGQARAALP